MAKAYLTPYGVGLGHASRLVTIANQLKHNNICVKFSSYGEAISYIDMNGFDYISVPPIEFSWTNGGFSIKNSAGNIPSWFTNFFRQLIKEIRNITTFNPNLIISDSRLSPVFAAKILGIPSIVILNQVKLLLSPAIRKFKIARIFEDINGEFLGLLWSVSDKVVIPDLPPPYTISENNLWNSGSLKGKVEYVGFTIPKLFLDDLRRKEIFEKLCFDKNEPIVFMHISGPMETRLPLIEIIIDACKNLGPRIQYIISEGRPKGDIEPKRLSSSGWYYEWCPIKDELFAISNVIVMRGGHTTISQAIQYGKPVVTIPIENHGEQIGNSDKIARMGIGVKIEPSNVKKSDIINAVKEVLENPKYLENISKIKKVTDNLQGIENVMKIIRSYI